MLRIGNYGRKSVYSDKSDSTDVQYKMSSSYCDSHYESFELYRYEDEGYTGANTDRPDYNRLVSDIKENKLDVVICYKIDRISRNVLDFSSFFSLCSDHNVEFVSIKEQIDTSTPLGRAMMYICSVFAQMERETIAERVKDNMIELSKSGKWAGGRAPLGFNRQKIIVNGKNHTVLECDPTGIAHYNMIADTFLQGYSLNGLETYFRKNGIKTLTGSYFSSTQLYNILKNPHCAPADPATYEYFSNLGCIIGSDKSQFDGSHGLVVYGRTSGGRKKKHCVNPPEKWIVSVGLHKPFITSEKWLAIQNKFSVNQIDKTRKYNIGILCGVLRCSCGYKMRVQHKVDKIYHKTYDNYFCIQRDRRGVEYCDRKFTSVSKLDNSVIDILKEIKLDKSMIDNYILKANNISLVCRSRDDVQKDINIVELKISNLTAVLGNNSSSSAAKYIISEMETLDKQLAGYKFELMEIDSIGRKKTAAADDKEKKYRLVCDIVDSLDTADYAEINDLIKSLFKECVYDGSKLSIKI